MICVYYFAVVSKATFPCKQNCVRSCYQIESTMKFLYGEDYINRIDCLLISKGSFM